MMLNTVLTVPSRPHLELQTRSSDCAPRTPCWQHATEALQWRKVGTKTTQGLVKSKVRRSLISADTKRTGMVQWYEHRLSKAQGQNQSESRLICSRGTEQFISAVIRNMPPGTTSRPSPSARIAFAVRTGERQPRDRSSHAPTHLTSGASLPSAS